jgi:hypothetical protein
VPFFCATFVPFSGVFPHILHRFSTNFAKSESFPKIEVLEKTQATESFCENLGRKKTEFLVSITKKRRSAAIKGRRGGGFFGYQSPKKGIRY